jgi:outer membrane protein assembly factor BamB
MIGAVATVPTAADENWPQWRGPGSPGVSSETNLLTEWGAEKNIAWKVDLPPGHSSPILWGNLYGDYLYLFMDNGVVTCLDAATGGVRYEGGRPPVPSRFIGSPVAFAGVIALTSEDGDTFMLKAGPSYEVLRTNSIGEPVIPHSRWRMDASTSEERSISSPSALDPDSVRTPS